MNRLEAEGKHFTLSTSISLPRSYSFKQFTHILTYMKSFDDIGEDPRYHLSRKLFVGCADRGLYSMGDAYEHTVPFVSTGDLNSNLREGFYAKDLSPGASIARFIPYNIQPSIAQIFLCSSVYSRCTSFMAGSGSTVKSKQAQTTRKVCRSLPVPTAADSRRRPVEAHAPCARLSDCNQVLIPLKRIAPTVYSWVPHRASCKRSGSA